MSWIRLICDGKNCNVTWSKKGVKIEQKQMFSRYLLLDMGLSLVDVISMKSNITPEKGRRPLTVGDEVYCISASPLVTDTGLCCSGSQRNRTPASLHLSSLGRDASIGSVHVTMQHRLVHSAMFCISPQAKIETQKQNHNTTTDKTMLNSRIPATA